MQEDISIVVHGSSTAQKNLYGLLRAYMSLITKHFKCTQVADKNGYFYYIGTQSNTMPWKNPHENRFIDVTYEPYNASIGYNNPADIVGVKPGQWGSGHDSYDTDDVRHFIIVDLLNNPPLCPDHYTIAHTWEGWSGRLKNWNLEASNDKIKWDTLREHKEDTSLTKTNAFRGVLNECGWPIVGCSTYYRYFRILGTGPNSDGSQHIVIGRLELYGTIRVRKIN